mmetsp:Transcript_2193/g.8735  ORF Transcript_2193/g.8735 Transcript_2193/m.8735 type:complete len:206 (-) Transcript_2193:144-761(-)
MARRAASRSRARMRHAHTHTRARATSGRRAALPRGARRIIITHRIQARLSSRDDECSHFAFSTLRPARCLLPLTSARTALSDARILMMADEVQPSAFAAMGGFHSAALRTSRRAAMPLGKSACLGPRRCLALGRIALSCGGTTYGSSSPSAPSDTSVRNSSASFIRSRLSAMSLLRCCERSSKASARTSVGRCVRRTPVSVLLRC